MIVVIILSTSPFFLSNKCGRWQTIQAFSGAGAAVQLCVVGLTQYDSSISALTLSYIVLENVCFRKMKVEVPVRKSTVMTKLCTDRALMELFRFRN